AGPYLYDDVGDEGRQQDAQACTGHSQEEAVLQGQQGQGIFDDFDPVPEAHQRKGADAGNQGVGHQRGIQQNRHRQHDHQEGQRADADEQRDPGALQLDDRGTVAASRYGYELAAFGGERAVQNNQRDGCAEYAHAQRGGLAVIRGKPRGDHLVQIGGQYVDLAGHAQHAGYG